MTPELPAEPLVVRRLRERLPDALLGVETSRDELTLRVRPGAIVEVCRLLKQDPDLQYNFFADLCAVDFPGRERRFEVVYNLFSIPYARRVRLRVELGEGERIPSITALWRGADWHEREAYDDFGVVFDGHPDLRRIRNPEDFDGHPMRKDYPVQDMPKWWEEGRP